MIIMLTTITIITIIIIIIIIVKLSYLGNSNITNFIFSEKTTKLDYYSKINK